jgi:hypothetical protein
MRYRVELSRLPTAAAKALEPAFERIGAFCDGESTVIVHASLLQRLRQRLRLGVAGDAADVFIGNTFRSETKVGATRICFENLIEPLPKASHRAGRLRAAANPAKTKKRGCASPLPTRNELAVIGRHVRGTTFPAPLRWAELRIALQY